MKAILMAACKIAEVSQQKSREVQVAVVKGERRPGCELMFYVRDQRMPETTVGFSTFKKKTPLYLLQQTEIRTDEDRCQ